MSALDACLFDVDASGVLIVPDMPAPKIRRDVFSSIEPASVHSCARLVSLISDCEPLVRHFRAMAHQFLADHEAGLANQSFIQGLTAGKSHHRHSLAENGRLRLILRALRSDPDDGWREWIEYSGEHALEGFLQIVRDWLDSDIDWSEIEHFTEPWCGQQAALDYFQRLPPVILNALGVELEDGCLTGASAGLARLTKPAREFNQVAQLLSLPCLLRTPLYQHIMQAHDD